MSKKTMTTIKYYKFINVHEDGKMQNKDFIYKMGLNENKTFNAEPSCSNSVARIEDFTPNAFYISDVKHIHEFIEYGNTLFEVSCPNDSSIIRVNRDKYKTNKLIIERKVDDNIFLQDIYIKAVQSNRCGIKHVPEEYKTPELYLRAVQIDGYALEYIPNKHKTYELCLQAVQTDGYVLRYVPDKHKTYELCLRAVQSTIHALSYVPVEHRTAELCRQAIQPRCARTVRT